MRYPTQELQPNYPTTSVPGRRGHVFPLPTLSLRDADGCCVRADHEGYYKVLVRFLFLIARGVAEEEEVSYASGD